MLNDKRRFLFRLFFTSWIQLKRRRRRLRWMVYSALGIFLFFVACYFWLCTAGLPGVATDAIVGELKARGFDFSAQKLKLSWNLGVEARELHLATPTEGSAEFFLKDAILNLSFWNRFFGGNFISSVSIRNGYVEWPLDEDKANTLKVDKIIGTMVFDEAGENMWTLKNLVGELLGMQIRIGGELKNSDALRNLKMSKKSNPEALKRTKKMVLEILNILQTFTAEVPPKLFLRLHLDAADWLNSDAEVVFDLPVVQGRYGKGDHLRVRLALCDATVQPGSSRLLKLIAQLNHAESASIHTLLDAVELNALLVFNRTNLVPQGLTVAGRMEWLESSACNANNLQFEFKGERSSTNTPILFTLDTLASNLILENIGTAASVESHTEMLCNWDFENTLPAIFNPELFQHLDCERYQELLQHPDFPQQVKTVFNVAKPNTKWGSMGWADLEVALSSRQPTEYARLNTVDYGPWRWAIPLNLNLKVSAGDVVVSDPSLLMEHLDMEVAWAAPEFEIVRFNSSLYKGQADLSAKLNVENRQAVGMGDIDFDVHKISHFFDAAGQRWLSQYGWMESQPPHVTAAAKVVLAPWTNLKPDWKDEVLPTLELKGHIQGANANFKGIPALTAEGDFCLTNSLWTLPEFKVTRPEGTLVFYYEGNSINQDYLWKFDSHCDPRAMTPVLGKGAATALEMFEFTEPPHIEAKLWGRWKDLSKSGLDGTLDVTNFVFREQPFESIQSHVTYTNGIVRAVETNVGLPDAQGATVDEVVFSNPEQQVTITNALCNLFPRIVTKIVGPQTDRVMENYKFVIPPHITVNGAIPVDDADHSFMDFEITQCDDFRWWKLNTTNLTGVVQWRGERLRLTNLVAGLYGGTVNGWAAFDFTDDSSRGMESDTETNDSARGSFFQFDATLDDCDLKSFVSSFSTNNGKITGTLDGHLVVTDAYTSDWDSWNGYGSASITNGLIWDIPVFGLFSGLLNEFSPGLGNSQADKGDGTFVMRNSIIWTDDLEIASPTFQILYKGSIDFHRNLDARVDIDVLKGWGGLGKVFNFATTPFRRIFRTEVGGTFSNPVLEFAYIPKPVMMLVRPFKTFKDLFGLGKVKEVEEKQLLESPNPAGE